MYPSKITESQLICDHKILISTFTKDLFCKDCKLEWNLPFKLADLFNLDKIRYEKVSESEAHLRIHNEQIRDAYNNYKTLLSLIGG
jgi:hypothetical protein